jgi:MFS family permease
VAPLRTSIAPPVLDFPWCLFFFDFGLSIYFFLFNIVLIGHGYTEKTLGVITSTMAIGNLAGAIPAGKLARRFGLRPVLLFCFLLASIVFSARAILLSFAWQIPLALLAGITLSAWAICVAPAVAHLTNEQQRPFAFSLVFSLGIGVGALGGLAGSRFPGWFSSRHVIIHSIKPDQLVLLGSCCIVALGIWPVTKLVFSNLRLPVRTRPLLSGGLLRFLTAIAVWGLVTGSFSPFATVFFAQHLRMALPEIGNAFSISQVVQVAAVLVAPVLMRRFGLVGGIVSTQLVAASLLLALAVTAHPATAITAYVGFTAFQWMNEPGLYSLLMGLVSADERSGASSYNSFVMSASQALAATLAGGAFARYGYPFALRGIAVIALVAAMLFWRMRDQPEMVQTRELDTQKTI